jgi:hypothetical protein
LIPLTDENSSDEDELVPKANDINGLVSSNGTQWQSFSCQQSGREGAHNIFTGRSGFRKGLNPQSRKEAFEVFFENCIDCAIHNTNKFGERVSREKGKKWCKVDSDEMCAFIGLHLLAGAYKAAHRHTEELWSQSDGHPLYRATMSYTRWKQIKSALRFDDKRRRDSNDPLAPARTLVELFNRNLQHNYEPGINLTVDEQLIEFHGRVKFRRYIPTKPGKYGLLVYWITEAESSFPLRCLPYIGTKTLLDADKSPCTSIPEAITLHLCQSFLDKGRNITADNYFTSLDLAKKLKTRKTTLVGTIRSNRREIPPKALNISGRQRGDTEHFTHDGITLCSFWDKKRRPVLLLSSMHRGQTYLVEGKSDMVQCYNSTKSGVDNFDKLIRNYRSQRKCRRWPYAFFFTLCDAACISAMQFPEFAAEKHYQFKKELAKELCLPLAVRRSQLPSLKGSIRTALALLGIEKPIEKTNSLPDGAKDNKVLQGRCHLCPRSLDQKQRTKCDLCQKFVCQAHRSIVCEEC